MNVRPAAPADAAAIATIHEEALPGDLLTSLGPAFTRRLHGALLASPLGRAFVAEEAGTPVGFVVGTPDAPALYRRILVRDGAGLAARAALGLAAAPRRIGAALSVLRYGAGGEAAGDLRAELVVMGVRTSARGRGAGRALWRALAERLRADGAPGFFLVVRAENRPARAFYEALGMRPTGERRISGGAMVRYEVRWR